MLSDHKDNYTSRTQTWESSNSQASGIKLSVSKSYLYYVISDTKIPPLIGYTNNYKKGT